MVLTVDLRARDRRAGDQAHALRAVVIPQRQNREPAPACGHHGSALATVPPYRAAGTSCGSLPVPPGTEASADSGSRSAVAGLPARVCARAHSHLQADVTHHRQVRTQHFAGRALEFSTPISCGVAYLSIGSTSSFFSRLFSWSSWRRRHASDTSSHRTCLYICRSSTN